MTVVMMVVMMTVTTVVTMVVMVVVVVVIMVAVEPMLLFKSIWNCLSYFNSNVQTNIYNMCINM